MSFSFRKIMSNIGYFKKPDNEKGTSDDVTDDPDMEKQRCVSQLSCGDAEIINFERPEPDSTSVQCATSLNLSETQKEVDTKKGSLSDTDLLARSAEKSKKQKSRSKMLKLDIKKANKSDEGGLNRDNVENTPNHVLLECQSAEIFSERLKRFDFSKSFDFDSDSFEDENFDIQSLSEDDISLISDESKANIQMCRKVGSGSQSSSEENQLVPSSSLESFGDVEIDKNEEERVTLLLNYKMKFEKMDSLLKKLLTEFQFHIEVSKIFNSRAFVTGLPGSKLSDIPKQLGEQYTVYIDKIDRDTALTASWNVVIQKEDEQKKIQLKNQLLSIRHTIDTFLKTYLKQQAIQRSKATLPKMQRSITFDVHKGKRLHKRSRLNTKKKIKYFDFPDIRDAMIHLFSSDNSSDTILEETHMKCECCCHEDCHDSDSGLKTKSEDRSMSITSSIGNFSLDSSTLTAYSESLDLIISYNSFQDSSLFSTLLQKAAIERITFYVQVHSIEIKCDSSEDFESKNTIQFYCPACKCIESEENGLLRHILSQSHCEKIHFLYKTAYIKKCVQSGKEIQPSTVLNPMKMYRDDNKIVCFGDTVYACSLCFENMIVGESVLMAHCGETEHLDRKEKLSEILE